MTKRKEQDGYWGQLASLCRAPLPAFIGSLTVPPALVSTPLSLSTFICEMEITKMPTSVMHGKGLCLVPTCSWVLRMELPFRLFPLSQSTNRSGVPTLFKVLETQQWTP